MKASHTEDIRWSRLDTDVLILGSGLAGMLLGILLLDSGARVTIASKETFIDSNTTWAQGGLAAVTPTNFIDSLSDHLADTTKSGAGLTDEFVARELIGSAPLLVQILNNLGVNFDRSADGNYELAREGGHSRARVLHSKDTTGRTLANVLLEQLKRRTTADGTNLTMLEHCFAYNILRIDGRAAGAEVLHRGAAKRIYARHVVLATGGAGQIYSRTTNPSVATADGVALAYRAGARLCDLEFMQFHPTALAKPGAPAFLISEAVRGAGAILIDGNAVPFARKFHADGELATRDVVARAIHSTMLSQELPSVGLDMRPIGEQNLLTRFPNIVSTCRTFGIDPIAEPVPVSPAAHYFMGGVWTDVSGQTTVPGLYAIGEVANTGLHGANRLASNSLLEAGVMAIKLAGLLSANKNVTVLPRLNAMGSFDDGGFSVPSSLQDFKRYMYAHASLIRTEAGLNALKAKMVDKRLAPISLNVQTICSANIFLVGNLITTAALMRNESRGSHFRADFPGQDEQLTRRLAVSNGNWQWLDPSDVPVKIDKQSALTA